MNAAPNERRHWPRYRAKSGTLLFNESTFAEIINISKGGVFCTYLSAYDERCPPVRLINLINTQTRTSFPAIPCVDLNYQEPGADMPLARFRKSRLRFIPASESFRRDLHRFIETIIADPV